MIVESGNDYVLQVKRNQKTLFNEIQRAIVEQVPLDYFEAHEKDHGRRSTWYVTVYNALNSIKTVEWKGLRRFIHVHKKTEEKGKGSHSDRFYMSSHYQSSARYYHSGIRGHWSIENSLHWVKDVIIGEDHNQIRKDNGPVNSAVFSSIAINIHRSNGQYSISEGQMKNSSNVNELFEWIKAA
ncbi:MAG: ISAs1 family transposase [Bacteroidota bacterium]